MPNPGSTSETSQEEKRELLRQSAATITAALVATTRLTTHREAVNLFYDVLHEMERREVST